MSVFGKLLRIARSVVLNVVRTVTSQVNMVQEAVASPIRAMVQQVIGGAWRGEGAERFADEMTSLIIPQLSDLTRSFTNTSSSINKALNTMNRADKASARIANGLSDVFKGIYR